MTKTLLNALAVFTLTSASLANATPVENNADLYSPITREFAGILGDVVSSSGYRCDSVSGAVKSRKVFRVNCNGYRYTYEIKDIGGQWRIFVK